MEFLVRKISEAKWKVLDFMNKDDISADAISGGCLRTYSNKLSLWKCKNEKSDIDEAVLAIVSTMEVPEKINIILIENEFLANNFNIEETEGNTTITELRQRHVDLTKMTMNKICLIAEHIAIKVRANIDFHRYSKKQLIEIVKNAIISGRLKIDDLETKFKVEIEKQKLK